MVTVVVAFLHWQRGFDVIYSFLAQLLAGWIDVKHKQITINIAPYNELLEKNLIVT